MSSSAKDVWDFATGQYVRWHALRRCWVDKDDRRVREPQRTPAATPGVAGAFSQSSAATPHDPAVRSRPSGSSVQDATGAMRSMDLASQSPSSIPTTRPPTTQSAGAPMKVSYTPTAPIPIAGVKPPQTGSLASTDLSRSSGSQAPYHATGTNLPMQPSAVRKPFAATLSDPSSGLKTRWEVSETTQYTDPINTSTNRSLNVKRIRDPESQEDRPDPAPPNEFKVYRVIEVLLVPPEEAASNVSRITPTGTGDIRLRRFVVVREIPERSCIEALPIKTYNFRGVAAPGVIKSHHSVIYTDKKYQRPTEDELPRRNSQGVFENGMQSQAIRVESFDRQKALDPMARLDYADRYEFDWGVSNIRLFGRVHDNSQASLSVQYNSVWTSIRTAVQGAVSNAQPTGNISGGLAVSARSSSTQGPSSTIANQGSSKAASVRSSASGPTGSNTGEAQALALLHRFAPSNSGPCTEQQLLMIFRYLQGYARQESLPVPSVDLTAQQLRELARDAAPRSRFIQKIKDQWQVASNVESESDHSDEDDEDDDDNEE